MDNLEFIEQHRRDDVRNLALKSCPDGVDLQWCLQQIEGWQTACHKLPSWAMDEAGNARTELWFPPRISMEQCSSQETAQYKAQVAIRVMGGKYNCHELIDLTGGYGVDFSYMARCFTHAVYVEKQPHLCDIARHNMPVLGLDGVDIVNADCTEAIGTMLDTGSNRLLFLDPARRDSVGRKVYALEDCTPNIVVLQDALLELAKVVIVKLSPMLDITGALRNLKAIAEVHVISVRGECRELLLVMNASGAHSDHASTTQPRYFCVNIADETDIFECADAVTQPNVAHSVLQYLYEPNASILKAGVQDALCERYGVAKLHPKSNLYTSEMPVNNFPGRSFRVLATTDFGKKNIRDFLSGMSQANITTRNFPTTVDALRKKLKLKDGGNVYLFATTLSDGQHVLIRCEKFIP